MKKIIIPLTIFSVLLGIGFYYGFLAFMEMIDLIINPICPTQTYISKEKVQDRMRYPLFEEAVARVGKRIYDREDYNCLDFSKDLVGELERAGIKSSIAVSKNRDHAWVVVWIEATTGSFTLPDEDLEILELRDKDLNVICNQRETL